jgi:hypothetical protein
MSDIRAQNEFTRKAANEAIDHNRAPRPDALLEFLCECSDGDCTEKVELTDDEYASLRGHPRRFALAGGHEQSEDERIVDEFDRYTVVQK